MTVGPERTNRMETCATAKREGVHFSMLSDANVTPLDHLHTMWCAANRRSTPFTVAIGKFYHWGPSPVRMSRLKTGRMTDALGGNLWCNVVI